MDALFESLQREFCPPLDSSLLAALLADINLDAPEHSKQSQIAGLRNTLIELSVHAEQGTSDALDFSYSDETSSSAPDFCTTTTTTSASDFSGGSARSGSAPFNSPLGFLQAALPHITTERLLRALAEEDAPDDALDMWEIISAILSEETEKEMRERDLDEEDMNAMAEVAWETVETKRVARKAKKKKAATSKITVSDVRQQQHVREAARSRSSGIEDPWAQLASLSTHIAQLLPPHTPSFFLSFFHSPKHASTPYAALCAALTAISSSPPDEPDAQHTTTLFHLLDMLLPAYTLSPDVLVADVELALNAAQGRGEDAFELVRVLRDLDADALSGTYEMGVYHAPILSPTSPLSPSSSAFPTQAQVQKTYSNSNSAPRPNPARALSVPLPTGPAATPPPPNLKLPPGPSGKSSGGWQAVPARRRAPHQPSVYPHAMHIPAYTRDVNGMRVRGGGNSAGKGGKGDVGELGGGGIGAYRRRVGESMRRRDELLREAARMWQRGNKRTRGGEVALYFAERAREFQEVARREALEAARLMVYSRRRDDTVDLHGVTAAEAVVIVNEILREGEWSADKPLKIITGRGSHSVGQLSVLKPAVKKALEEDGWVVGTWDAGVTVRGRRGGRG
ncbi:hypothetical protein K438DRAFT_1856968 [Mycena galopus ATCC 62051]|nr:hypothetical protein K438DRAFT_1856968 [Mycena galopus ATCC 62051]